MSSPSPFFSPSGGLVHKCSVLENEKLDLLFLSRFSSISEPWFSVCCAEPFAPYYSCKISGLISEEFWGGAEQSVVQQFLQWYCSMLKFESICLLLIVYFIICCWRWTLPQRWNFTVIYAILKFKTWTYEYLSYIDAASRLHSSFIVLLNDKSIF